MKSSRLSGIAWILAATVAGLLSAFLLGLGERPGERTVGFLLGAGALLAAATGILGLLRPSTVLARWSILLAVVWVVGAAAGTPWYMTGRDLVVFILLPLRFRFSPASRHCRRPVAAVTAGGTEASER